MSELKRVIIQAIKTQRETIVGRVLTDPVHEAFDQATPVPARIWTVTVDIGGNRVLGSVPIKSAGRSRAYAQRGQSVLLRKNTAGRYDVIGPADRTVAVAVVKKYNLSTNTEQSSANRGFTSSALPFTHLKGTGAPNSLWGDGSTPFTRVKIVDGLGNEVII